MQEGRYKIPWSVHMQFEGGAAFIKERLIKVLYLWGK